MQSIYLELRELSILLRRHMENNRIRQFDSNFTGMHIGILMYLYKNRFDDSLQRDFEKVFCIRRSTATSILQRMEKSELIVRVTDENDARMKKIILTPKALLIAEKIGQEQERFVQDITKNLSDQEIDKFLEITRKIKKNLE